MNPFTQKLMHLTAGILLALPLGGCATIPLQPVQGQVLEEGTNKPIAGAIVVGLWHGTSAPGFFVDSRTVCYHVETATADELGRFTLPPTEKEYKYRDGHHYTSIIAYKPGYQYARVQRTKGVTYLQPFIGGSEERLEQLSRFTGMQCGERENYAKQLIPLYRSIYEEAKSVAVTKEEKRSANNRLRDLEEMELGYDKAWENWRIREKTLE